MRLVLRGFLLACFTTLIPAPASAQERAYFVTYDHYLEERGNLEVALAATTGVPRGDGANYVAPWLELEYGVTGWWTAEFYLEGVAAHDQGSAFTGWRWENRFRPLKTERAVNPVIYVEFEDINEASRIQKEIVGRGAFPNESIDELSGDHARELEAKLILSSAVRGWNVAENLIVEKNLSADEGFEFGYSVGVSRALGGLASGTSCRFCCENFVVGVEAYGGLGDSKDVGLSDTRHFLAPVVAWHLSNRMTIKASAGFGLTDPSDKYLFRFGWAYEMPLGAGR
jgi:hypothetical protein